MLEKKSHDNKDDVCIKCNNFFFFFPMQKQCLLQMESLGVVQYNSGLPGYKLDFTGDLKIIQNNLLTTRGSHTRYNHSIFITKYDDDEEPEFNFNRVINKYAKRSG